MYKQRPCSFKGVFNMRIEYLRKLGFNLMDSNTEYTLKIINYARKEFANIDNYKSLFRLYENIVSKVSRERPASAQTINMLHDLGKIIINNISENRSIKITHERIIASLDLWERRIIEDCNEAARIASRRLVDGDVILTHSRSTCVLKAIEYAKKENKKLTFYVTESRPGMEGLVTAEKINSIGYPVKLIVDSAVRYFMKDIDKVLVGAEAVAVNGAVISKVGTSLISLIANEARVRVFVVAPISKFNIETLFGELVELPESDWRRLMSPDVLASLPENYIARVPIYDVTPPQYVDGIATERGLFAPQAIPVVLKDVYGKWPPEVLELEELVKKIKEIIG